MITKWLFRLNVKIIALQCNNYLGKVLLKVISKCASLRLDAHKKNDSQLYIKYKEMEQQSKWLAM